MDGEYTRSGVEAVREALPSQHHYIDDHGYDRSERKAKWKPSRQNDDDDDDDDYMDEDYADKRENHSHKKKKHKKEKHEKHRKHEKHGKKKSKHTDREKHAPKHNRNKATKSKQKKQTKFSVDQEQDAEIELLSRKGRNYSLRRKRHSVPEIRQCLGPGCMKVARAESKYCSEECGLKLAEQRIRRWLPERFAASSWDAEPIASRRDTEQLEQIRQEKEQIRMRLENLAERRRELDALIERAGCTQRDQGEGNDEEEDYSQIYCVVCGHEVHTSRALKHIERCFTKAESRTMFGSFEKARADAQDVFCDEYNPKLRTYCKRLKVLCPEHSHKLDKEDRDRLDGAPCGFPLTTRREKLQSESEGESKVEDLGVSLDVHAEDFNAQLPELLNNDVQFCSEPKASCSRHYSWDRLRKAQIDMERVRLWMRIEELHEQERRVNAQLAQRRNLLGILLHTTIDHCAQAAPTANENASEPQTPQVAAVV